MKSLSFFKLAGMLALLLGISLSATAQKGRFTLFSEDGDKFFLIVDGKRINPKADVRVEPTDLPGSRVMVKVIFEDSKKPSIVDAIYIKDFDNKYVYAKYVIRKKKDKYVIRISDYEEQLNVNQEWVQTHEEEAPAKTTTTSTTKTTTKPTSPANPGNQDVEKVNISMPGVSIKTNMGGIDMKVEEPEEEHTVVTTTRTTKTTRNGQVTTTKKTTGRPTAPNIGPEVEQAPAPAPAASTKAKPISATGYTSLINNIKRQGFDDSKVKIARLAFKNNAFSTKQITEIVKLVNFEQSRLDLAKAAYDNCTDKESFMDVSEAFNFSSSTEELTTFLEAKN